MTLPVIAPEKTIIRIHAKSLTDFSVEGPVNKFEMKIARYTPAAKALTGMKPASVDQRLLRTLSHGLPPEHPKI